MAGNKPGVSSAAQLHKTANAARRAKGKTTHENPLLPHATLKRMHASMLAAQRLERSSAPMLRKKSVLPFTGREAALIGTFIHLEPQDKISIASGDIVPRLLRGAKEATLVRELRSKTPRLAEENGVLPFLPPSERLAAALGVALAAKSAGNKSIVLLYLESSDLEGQSWISVIQTAGRLELPIVFLCLDSPTVPQQTRIRQSQQLRSVTALKGGVELVPVIPVDGHDVVAMYRAAQESVLRARSGIGPTLLWCERWDVATAGQSSVAQFEAYLAGKGLAPRKSKAS